MLNMKTSNIHRQFILKITIISLLCIYLYILVLRYIPVRINWLFSLLHLIELANADNEQEYCVSC